MISAEKEAQTRFARSDESDRTGPSKKKKKERLGKKKKRRTPEKKMLSKKAASVFGPHLSHLSTLTGSTGFSFLRSRTFGTIQYESTVISLDYRWEYSTVRL